MPLREEEQALVLSMANPQDAYALHAVALSCNRALRVQVGIGSEIDAVVEQLYGEGQSQMGDILAGVAAASVGVVFSKLQAVITPGLQVLWPVLG